MVSDGTEFAVGDIGRLLQEAKRNTKAKQEKWEKYYNRSRRDVQIKPKFEGPYRVLEVKNNGVVIWKAGKRLTVNVDQVRIYRHRKCYEMEIRTGSSDSNSSRQESSSFDGVQRRSNESQSTPNYWFEKSRMIKINENQKIGYKRSRESGSPGPERKIRKVSDHTLPKRALSSNYTTNSNLPKFRKKSQREETVAPSTSGYNLRPRGRRGVESRPAMEMKTQQGGPVRARKSKGRNYNPYIEERTRSDNRSARRRGDQQRKDQERKGASTRRSISLEVLVEDTNYKS
ncbi:uncharacterized protein TNCV_3248291 [Trichonephila clavipes]|nr:uncharacterized protein TNCV_3248291 [Trichonephila clavipes]